MLPVPEASLPAVEICSERSAAGTMRWARGAIVRKENDFYPVLNALVVVDTIAHRVDSLDDTFGHLVSGRGLGGKDEDSRGDFEIRVL